MARLQPWIHTLMLTSMVLACFFQGKSHTALTDCNTKYRSFVQLYNNDSLHSLLTARHCAKCFVRPGSSVPYYVASTVSEKMELKRGQDTQPASGRGIFERGLGIFTLPMRLLCPSIYMLQFIQNSCFQLRV